MFDPAMLGTAMIGLDAIRADRDRSVPQDDAVPARHRRRAARARRTLASVLRRTAQVLEPMPLPAG
jgi:hypothetical protein